MVYESLQYNMQRLVVLLVLLLISPVSLASPPPGEPDIVNDICSTWNSSDGNCDDYQSILDGSTTDEWIKSSISVNVDDAESVSLTIATAIHELSRADLNLEDLDLEGDSNFGDSSGDSHTFTGSLNIVSGGMRNHYYKLTAASHTVAAYDHIIGISSSAYVSIQLPSASVAGVGRVLVIKDEFNATRASANEIAVSASGAETIDHAATYCISGDSAALTLYSDGISKWFIY